jgi:putative nucleotidyltransferase with HDIG domain
MEVASRELAQGFEPEERLAVEALAALVETRDAATGEHAARVAGCAAKLAATFGCRREQVANVFLAGMLHDIGKVAIPDSILGKRCPLSEEEWEIVGRHPSVGADLVSQLGTLARLAPIIRAHHERYDGDGYPDGLRGAEIPLEARIISVADAFDAMTSERTYQPRMSVEGARARLRERSGTQFDPALVVTFDRHLAAVEVPLGRASFPLATLAA